MAEIITDKRIVFDVFMNSKVFQQNRRPTSRDDFGDESTIGLCVRRSGVDFKTVDAEATVFGRYLGQHEAGWIVGAYSALQFKPYELHVYSTLDLLKIDWELD